VAECQHERELDAEPPTARSQRGGSASLEPRALLALAAFVKAIDVASKRAHCEEGEADEQEHRNHERDRETRKQDVHSILPSALMLDEGAGRAIGTDADPSSVDSLID